MVCIAVTGAMRSTPTAALQAMLDLPPLHMIIESEARLATHRLKLSGMLNNNLPITGHAHELVKNPCCTMQMPCDRITKQLC